MTDPFPGSGPSAVTRRRLLAALAVALAAANAPAAAARRRLTDPDKRADRRRGRERAKGNGKDVVKVAKKHKGDRYVWGGESPRGFDCSGFTWYCYQKAAGMDIGRTVQAQWKEGKKVDRNEWEPGDIVFFENTFEPGLSHNGIYIGGDKFIHAENERTGVVISRLSSDYYSKHYAGARRLV